VGEQERESERFDVRRVVAEGVFTCYVQAYKIALPGLTALQTILLVIAMTTTGQNRVTREDYGYLSQVKEEAMVSR
jgi:hypothetical protein